MHIRVLGAGAGGGLPQWNCNCANCIAARAGRAGIPQRTQSSLAVSRDGENWVLLNASPDLRQQIQATPALHPRPEKGVRDSPIKAVVVTNGDVDHIMGLIHLREAQAFALYATARVHEVIGSNSVFNILAPGIVPRWTLPLGQPVLLNGAQEDLGLSVEAFPVPGKIALYLEDEKAGPGLGSQEGDTVALEIRDLESGKSFFYVPGCDHLDDHLRRRLTNAELVFFDGTLWHDAEMVRSHILFKTGHRMGHISMSGPDGSIAAFQALNVRRKIFVHINNTNPTLDERSRERAEAEAAGWEIGRDGMEVVL